MTPREAFESKKDLSNERKAISDLGVSDRYDFMKLPISYRLDYAMIRKKPGGNWFGSNILSFVEIKTRSGKSSDKTDFSISAMKITYGMLLSRATDKPFLLVVKWTNETLICNVGQVNWQVKMGGRVKNKRDDADIEPMMYCGIEESFVTPDAFFKGGPR
jgi:hypothetical protein